LIFLRSIAKTRYMDPHSVSSVNAHESKDLTTQILSFSTAFNRNVMQVAHVNSPALQDFS